MHSAALGGKKKRRKGEGEMQEEKEVNSTGEIKQNEARKKVEKKSCQKVFVLG